MNEKRPIFVTPKGTLLYPHITKPDTKFKAEGIYGTKISLPPSEARDELIKIIKQAVVDSLQAAIKENPKKEISPAKSPISTEKDRDGEPTGNLILNVKMRAYIAPKSGGDPFTQQPVLFDGRNHPINIKTIHPWTGTEARISFEIVPFFTDLAGAGASLRLKAVQILSLVEGGGRSAEEYGFDSDENGWNSSDQQEQSTELPEDDLPF